MFTYRSARYKKTSKKVMVALDIRQTVAEDPCGVDLIIVKHAPIFRPIKDLVADRAQKSDLYRLDQDVDIAVYVSHTNIDIVPDEPNDGQLLDITLSLTGEGFESTLSCAQTFGQLADKVKELWLRCFALG